MGFFTDSVLTELQTNDVGTFGVPWSRLSRWCLSSLLCPLGHSNRLLKIVKCQYKLYDLHRLISILIYLYIHIFMSWPYHLLLFRHFLQISFHVVNRGLSSVTCKCCRFTDVILPVIYANKEIMDNSNTMNSCLMQ